MNKEKAIDIFLAIVILALIFITGTTIGYYNGMLHVIKDTEITQKGEILTFTLDGDDWIYILSPKEMML